MIIFSKAIQWLFEAIVLACHNTSGDGDLLLVYLYMELLNFIYVSEFLLLRYLLKYY